LVVFKNKKKTSLFDNVNTKVIAKKSIFIKRSKEMLEKIRIDNIFK
jgi:hypothetical protein